jgi:hypothetical protein
MVGSDYTCFLSCGAQGLKNWSKTGETGPVSPIFSKPVGEFEK